MESRSFAFLLASTRVGGNSELLARTAAQGLPAHLSQWVRLTDHPLEPFVDLRHAVALYGEPLGNERTLCDFTVSCSDLVFVFPLYWYGIPAQLQRYLEYWSAWLRVPSVDFRRRMEGKRLWAICSSTGPWEEAEPTLKSLELTAKYLKMTWSGAVLGRGSKPGDILSDDLALGRARRLFEVQT